MARPSPAILGPLGRQIQDMHLDTLHKGREAFSKIKALLKKAAARTREALLEAMGEALASVTTQDVRGWFTHCGYEIRDQAS
jgi:hypothetical protein